jgi:hypothetical protein
MLAVALCFGPYFVVWAPLRLVQMGQDIYFILWLCMSDGRFGDFKTTFLLSERFIYHLRFSKNSDSINVVLIHEF